MDVSRLEYNLTGKTVLVTGADGRLGYQVSLAAARAGASVIASCRTEKEAQETKEKLEAQLGGRDVEAVTIDLSSFASIRNAGKEVLRKHKSLDVLANVAGVAFQDNVTSDGFVGTLQINVLSPALLTEVLLPALHTAPQPRVVYIGSASGYADMHFPADPSHVAAAILNWTRGTARPPVDTYSLSKLLDVHYAKEQAVRRPELSVFSVVPGYFRDPPSAYPCPRELIKFSPCPQSPAQGATSTFFAVAQPGIEGSSGAMLDFDTHHNPKDYYNITQDGETCIPRPLPRFAASARAAWYDQVQHLVAEPATVAFV